MTRMYKDYQQGSVVLTNISKDVRYIHVETELGIFNIWLNGTDNKGRRIERVSPVGSANAGEKIVKVVGTRLVELKRRG